jgi:hypothetical protein
MKKLLAILALTSAGLLAGSADDGYVASAGYYSPD